MKRTESKDLVSFLVIDHSIHEKETVQTDAQLIFKCHVRKYDKPCEL